LRAFLSAADEPAEEDVAMAGKLIEENGGRDIAMEEATRRLGAAMQSLDRIEVASEARRDLEEIAGFITAREF
jgi:geranylgeranyl pyrophosphate synthase